MGSRWHTGDFGTEPATASLLGSGFEAPLVIPRELLVLAARGELTLRVGIAPGEESLAAEDEDIDNR